MRKRVLIVLPIAALLIGGYLARGPLKSWAREQWHAWQRPAGPAPAAEHGTSLTDEAITSDPPPFDRVVASRSCTHTAPDGRVLRPNLHFDMEHSADPDRVSAAKARSGERSMRLAPSDEYSAPIKRAVGEVADTLAAVVVGSWVQIDAADPRLTVVITVHRDGQQIDWYGKELRASEHQPGTWQRIQAELLFRDKVLLPTDVVSIYWWNRAGVEVFLDDVDLVFRSSRVPGTGGAPKYDLEQGRMPPPTAAVRWVGAATPADMGVIPGQEAPPIAEVRVPLDHGRILFHRHGDAVARLMDGDREVAFVRLWTPELGRDLLGFERILVTHSGKDLLAVGYDVVPAADGRWMVATDPAPLAARLHITLP